MIINAITFTRVYMLLKKTEKKNQLANFIRKQIRVKVRLYLFTANYDCCEMNRLHENPRYRVCTLFPGTF